MQKTLNAEQQLSYIAAFMDGEGCVHFRPELQKPLRQIAFTNTDKELFNLVCDLFRQNGFHLHTRERAQSNPRHATSGAHDATTSLVVVMLSGLPFAKMVPLQHRGKRERLEAIIADYDEVEAMGRVRRPYRKTRWTGTTKEERERHSVYMRSRRLKAT